MGHRACSANCMTVRSAEQARCPQADAEPRGVCDVIDRHSTLSVHIGRTGTFAANDPDARALGEVIDGEQHRLVVHPV
ncbi:hypothetical protein ABT007_26920 [Streptomyces griseus]|uniref:hypothetical protein n=1 Tax=Streptomyces griseus TaxID=1911 RepID=UPI0033225202